MSILLFFYFIREWPITEILHQRVDRIGMSQRIRNAWLIYLSDIGLVGGIYLDRYVVDFFLGLSVTGVFSFYWSLANALQNLISTAVIQVAQPKLVSMFRQGDFSAWLGQLRAEFVKAITTAVGLATVIFFGTKIAVAALSIPVLDGGDALFVMILLASIIKVISDILNIGLSSAEKDKIFALLNIVGVVVSALTSVIFVRIYGINGAGIGLIASSATLMLVRAFFIASLVRRHSVVR
jgi:O-antigen/teichoic acid export membrane protein